MTTKIYQVSELLNSLRTQLERDMSPIGVRGEISSFTRAASGHCYFSLKDPMGVLNTVIFQGDAANLDFRLSNRMEVICYGKMSIYQQQGRMQLVVKYVERVGIGHLARAFDELKQKLQKEGLFDSERKRLLPVFPRRIALITSPTGAALRDLLNVIRRRSPSCSLLIASCQVQGDGAALQIVHALEAVNRLPNIDLVILGRGGGSIEDLWTFNEEIVARAIAASNIPVLTGIGHETDWTIADYVADKRAPTPSAAAEIAIPDEADIHQILHSAKNRLYHAMLRLHRNHTLRFEHLRSRLQPPHRKIAQQRLKLTKQQHFVQQMLRTRLETLKQLHRHLEERIIKHNPSTVIASYRQRWERLSRRLTDLIHRDLQIHKQRLIHLAQRLNDLSPIAILERGYALVYSTEQRLLRDTEKVQHGDKIHIRLYNGSILATVESTNPKCDK